MSKKVNDAATDLHTKLNELEHSSRGLVELSSDALAHIVGGAYMARKMSLSSQLANPVFKLDECGCTCNVTTCCKACTP